MNWIAYKSLHTTLRQFLEERFKVDDAHCRMRIVDFALVGDRAYVALEWIMKDVARRQVIGVVFFVKRTPKGDGDEICWHEMSESMMPQAFDCPERILRVLTPTDDPNALRWRALCRHRQTGSRLNALAQKLRGGKIAVAGVPTLSQP